jgi:hypothetical protein
MQDFDTQEHDSKYPKTEKAYLERGKSSMRYLLKRFILILSFGPGVLGFLWLVGKIVRK